MSMILISGFLNSAGASLSDASKLPVIFSMNGITDGDFSDADSVSVECRVLLGNIPGSEDQVVQADLVGENWNNNTAPFSFVSSPSGTRMRAVALLVVDGVLADSDEQEIVFS